MNEYGKEALKEQYEEELKETYKKMLEREEERLEEVNKEWVVRRDDMLEAIAKYDVATTGGKSRDLNTLSVEIITKIEQFKAIDQDPSRIEKATRFQNNINALNRLLK